MDECECSGVNDAIHARVYDNEEAMLELHVAAANGNDEMIALLLDNNIDVNSTLIDNDSRKYGVVTPLMQAARRGHTSTVRLLLERGADPNAANRFGVTALCCAVRSGHVATVRAILINCPQLVASDLDGVGEVTPMIIAAQLGHDPILRLLCQYRFSVNRASHHNDVTPLMMAAANGHMRSAQILVDHGADVTAVTCPSMRTALDIAILSRKRQVRCFLEQKILLIKSNESAIKESDIFYVIQFNRLDQMKRYLSMNNSTNLIIETESIRLKLTPLQYAAKLGYSDVIKLLLNAGVQLNSIDSINGWTALIFALFHGHNEVALELIEAGADVNVQLPGGFVAFDIATVIGETDPELIVLLAKLTDGKYLHPLAKVILQESIEDTTDTKKSPKLKNFYVGLRKRLARWMPTKLKRLTDSIDLQVGTNNCTQLVGLPSGDQRNLLGKMPIVSASPCSSFINKSPVRPTPPLLPSMVSIETSIDNLNMNASINNNHYNGNGNRMTTFHRTLGFVDLKTVYNSPDGAADELDVILKKYSLNRYKQLFNREAVDFEVLKMLKFNDLINLGIDEEPEVNRILQVVAELNR